MQRLLGIERAPLHHRRLLLVRLLLLAGQRWDWLTRFNGPCIFFSLLLCWRSRLLFYISNLINSMNTSTAAYKKWTLSWFRYNVVFRYLLSVRRVQSELQHCWALQMQRKHLKSNQTDAVKCRLRNHMAFLVDNLQYYLQVTTWIIYFAASQFAYYTHWIYFRYFLHCSSGGCSGVPVFAALTTDQRHTRLWEHSIGPWPFPQQSPCTVFHSAQACECP